MDLGTGAEEGYHEQDEKNNSVGSGVLIRALEKTGHREGLWRRIAAEREGGGGGGGKKNLYSPKKSGRFPPSS